MKYIRLNTINHFFFKNLMKNGNLTTIIPFNLLAIICLLIPVESHAQTSSGNYLLIINGDTINTAIDKPMQYKIATGEELTILLTQPDMLTYSDDMLSFNYPKGSSVIASEIDEELYQIQLSLATGSGFLIQEYLTIDPSMVTRFMLNEITKESVSYGYDKTETAFSKKLRDGKTLSGIKARLEYRGEVETYLVAAYGGKDEGVLLMTMLMGDDDEEAKEVIELLLNSLKLTF